jgi:hypothetical protein
MKIKVPNVQHQPDEAEADLDVQRASCMSAVPSAFSNAFIVDRVDSGRLLKDNAEVQRCQFLGGPNNRKLNSSTPTCLERLRLQRPEFGPPCCCSVPSLPCIDLLPCRLGRTNNLDDELITSSDFRSPTFLTTAN